MDLLGAFASSNPAMYKALMAGGTKFLSDDEASLKDVGITAGTLAAAPTAIGNKSGSMAIGEYASKGTDTNTFKF